MKHYGDITKLNGAELPVVDIITGGSPCQDLSVAGKRAGLAGERSGLFMEQIRIIKEMRENDRQRAITEADDDIRLVRPRYLVWENVPGALSSPGGDKKGQDFRCVLEEICRVADKTAVIPGPPKGGWPPSGCIMGSGEYGIYSVAWRVHDAQFWGVPQRRKRIALVADFGGQTAPEILFERKGVSGDFEESGKEGEDAAGDAERGVGKTSEPILLESNQNHATIQTNGISTALPASAGMGGGYVPMVCLNDQGGQQMDISEDVSGTLRAQEHGYQPIVYGIGGYNSEGMLSDNPHSGIYEAETARTLDLNGGSPACNQGGMAVVQGAEEAANDMYVVQSAMAMQAIGEYKQSNAASSLKMRDYKDATDLVVASFYPQMKAESQCFRDDNISNTLVNGTNPGFQNGVCYGLDRAAYNQGQNAKYDFSVEEEKIATQTAKGPGAVLPWTNSIVRRLTPMECERLQGYPDGWTDIGEWTDSKGKLHKDADSPRYKALGNSIALPFWEWMAGRMVKYIDHKPTMASLFDGIGGFPLVFSRAGCEPVWASEIEEFPIAVTKIRFPEEQEQK